MFKNLKQIIQDLSYNAVNMAEQSLDTTTGQEKKSMAIEYVVSRLPVAAIFKNLISMLLSRFIDEAIEIAFVYMKEVQNDE